MATRTKSPAATKTTALPGKPSRLPAQPFPTTPLDQVPPRPRSRWTLQQIQTSVELALRNAAQHKASFLTFKDDNIQGHGVVMVLDTGQRILIELMEES